MWIPSIAIFVVTIISCAFGMPQPPPNVASALTTNTNTTATPSSLSPPLVLKPGSGNTSTSPPHISTNKTSAVQSATPVPSTENASITTIQTPTDSPIVKVKVEQTKAQPTVAPNITTNTTTKESSEIKSPPDSPIVNVAETKPSPPPQQVSSNPAAIGTAKVAAPSNITEAEVIKETIPKTVAIAAQNETNPSPEGSPSSPIITLSPALPSKEAQTKPSTTPKVTIKEEGSATTNSPLPSTLINSTSLGNSSTTTAQSPPTLPQTASTEGINRTTKATTPETGPSTLSSLAPSTQGSINNTNTPLPSPTPVSSISTKATVSPPLQTANAALTVNQNTTTPALPETTSSPLATVTTTATTPAASETNQNKILNSTATSQSSPASQEKVGLVRTNSQISSTSLKSSPNITTTEADIIPTTVIPIEGTTTLPSSRSPKVAPEEASIETTTILSELTTELGSTENILPTTPEVATELRTTENALLTTPEVTTESIQTTTELPTTLEAESTTITTTQEITTEESTTALPTTTTLSEVASADLSQRIAVNSQESHEVLSSNQATSSVILSPPVTVSKIGSITTTNVATSLSQATAVSKSSSPLLGLLVGSARSLALPAQTSSNAALTVGSTASVLPCSLEAKAQSTGTPIPIISESEVFDNNGSFNFSYATGNGINVAESGFLKPDPTAKVDDENDSIQVLQGNYSYTAPDGSIIQMSYVADENGFRPILIHLPRPIANDIPNSSQTDDDEVKAN